MPWLRAAKSAAELSCASSRAKACREDVRLAAIRRAFEAAGLRFIDEGEFAGGVAPARPSEEKDEVIFDGPLSGTDQVTAKEVVLEGPALRPEQSRMARAALNWSLEAAAEAAGVSRRTVLRFEPRLATSSP